LNSKKEKASEIVRRLKKEYPSATTELIHRDPFQLLIATILSAQSTDVQVNKVLPALFKKYDSPKKFSEANLKELKELIHSCGYFNQKAKRIKQSSKVIHEKFNDKVPESMSELVKLQGVGRKTANIVLSYGFGHDEGIAVDTHVFRLSHRLGLSKAKSQDNTEQDLLKLIPKNDWGAVNGSFISHGRRVCTARNPKHKKCVLFDLCPGKKLKA